MSDGTVPAAKRRKLDLSEDVKVLVGPEGQSFTVHKSVLCNHSTFFRAALQGSFKEAGERTVRLPDIDVESFRAYTQWAYSGEIFVLNPKEMHKDVMGQVQLEALINLYITADRLGDTLLRNRTVDCLVKCTSTDSYRLTPKHISYAYGQLDKGSKLCQFMVDTVKRRQDSEWLRRHRSLLPAEFFADLAINLTRSTGFRFGTRTPPACDFHDHDEEVPPCPTR